ncbi:MAG TPA: DUF5666 domain-containing protein [Polyangium sp.]|nr:DUF5666 domain-containing protein [Polyangium sp.]
MKPQSILLLAAASFVALVSVEGQRAQAQDNEVELAGVATNVSGTCPSLEFTVAGHRVATHAGTEFDDGLCADLRNGRRIELEGFVQRNGVLLVREIDLRP